MLLAKRVNFVSSYYTFYLANIQYFKKDENFAYNWP
jgi:hypothetical protein